MDEYFLVFFEPMIHTVPEEGAVILKVYFQHFVVGGLVGPYRIVRYPAAGFNGPVRGFALVLAVGAVISAMKKVQPYVLDREIVYRQMSGLEHQHHFG